MVSRRLPPTERRPCMDAPGDGFASGFVSRRGFAERCGSSCRGSSVARRPGISSHLWHDGGRLYPQTARGIRGGAAGAAAQGHPSLTDLALCAGFSSHAHMAAMFKRVTGMTPTEYRKATELHQSADKKLNSLKDKGWQLG